MEKMKDNSFVDDLIMAYFCRSISRDEINQLESWIAESDANRLYFEKQQEIWLASSVARPDTRFDSELAFNRFINHTKRQMKSTRFVWFTSSVWIRVAAVALLVLMVSSAAFWMGEKHITNRLAEVRIEAPLGSRTRLYLPDGSLVWLNAGSKLVYSPDFGVNNRRLSIEGEGYFEVTKNKKLPFSVKSTGMEVVVFGTKFNLRNYSEDDEAAVTLLEGSVGLNKEIGKKQQMVLRPDQRVVINKKTGLAHYQKIDASRSTQWTKGLLCFNQEKLVDITRELARSYNVDFIIRDSILNNYRFYGNFTRTEQSIHEVLEILASTNKLTYQIKNDRSVILYAK